MDKDASRPIVPLEYAPMTERRHSVWSVVGFALAVMWLLLALLAGLDVWSDLRGGAVSSSVRISPVWYAIMLSSACLCVFGLRRGRKALAIWGIVITAMALITLIVLSAGSPWR